MKNKCIACGNCCRETEMILSKKDIENIINSPQNTLKEVDFVENSIEGFFQLRNVNGCCFFFDSATNLCKIYDVRPQGCRFYPLIYDSDKNSCVFDRDCPRTELFYPNQKSVRKTCAKIIWFLEKQVLFTKLK